MGAIGQRNKGAGGEVGGRERDANVKGKEGKRENNRDQKCEEEGGRGGGGGMCWLGSQDDSQLSLSSPVTRHEPALWREREKEATAPSSCFAMWLPWQPGPRRKGCEPGISTTVWTLWNKKCLDF